tara:strand:+ start:50 stop:379 length:330 start_codon:yes stop_codon:yes gene_type:complete
MKVKSFPHCCTAQILCGFGQTYTAPESLEANFTDPTVEQIKSQIGVKLNASRTSRHAMLTATTNDQQTNANQALEECGFLSSDWMSKEQHPETKVKLWWFPINEKQING